MKLLEGKKGLIFGVANDRSIAVAIGQQAAAHGAVCGYPYLPGEKNERRVRKALEDIGQAEAWAHPCDVAKDAEIESAFAAARERFDAIDFVVHSVAYADRAYLKHGQFVNTPRDVFAQALDISAYSLIPMARAARAMMPRGGSIIAMTYYGSEKIVPGYNVMGVAKSALECAARYLAGELGDQGIRVNTISAGPLRTLSSMAVGGIDEIFGWVEKKAPLKRNITQEDVGRLAVYLLSDLSSAVTAENIFVDAGYSAVGL